MVDVFIAVITLMTVGASFGVPYAPEFLLTVLYYYAIQSSFSKFKLAIGLTESRLVKDISWAAVLICGIYLTAASVLLFTDYYVFVLPLLPWLIHIILTNFTSILYHFDAIEISYDDDEGEESEDE